MSTSARERAAARRAHKRTSPRRPRQAEPAVTENDAENHESVTETQREGDDAVRDDEPAVATVTENRDTINVELRPRDRRFLEALAAHDGITPEKALERIVRREHVRLRASTGATMRYDEFQGGDSD